MARKARQQRISYVLPLANPGGGHRLGINGLAVDSDRSILYSGGRDGVICAWDLNLDLAGRRKLESKNPFRSADDSDSDVNLRHQTSARSRNRIQAHTHWVNDIVLAQDNSALVSASSDVTVKLWRPHAEDHMPPQTIGLHTDYVKCLATPSARSDWVASGGLDRKISLWDLNGGGQRLQIDVDEEESGAKGSVYALSARGSILASGGPESIVRVWDPRSGKRVTKFVGHTDNVRDILISEDGDKILSASSDQTVKLWSVTAGRCMHTLTMHNDSVWSLYSDHPQLSVFYSSDRSGLVAKTDARGLMEVDEGLCVAVCQEHEGVNTIARAGDYIWTATSSSSINRWKDVTEKDVQMPQSYWQHRHSSVASRSRMSTTAQPTSPTTPTNSNAKPELPLSCILRLSNTAMFPAFRAWDAEASTIFSATSARKQPESADEPEIGATTYRHSPEDCIEGQLGLIQHVMLSDRKRVLTMDTAGEIMMWDLVKCVPIRSFGKRHLEDVVPEVNTIESVANWCTVNTRTGRLSCVLEEAHCFDAEVYADELDLKESINFREDQRINLGKWVLRYLFSNFIDEEIKRDEAFRKSLADKAHPERLQRVNAPSSIQLPSSHTNGWTTSPGSANDHTPVATNGFHHPVWTPGLSIGVATPANPTHPHSSSHKENHLPPTAEEGASLERTASRQSQTTSSYEKSGDYFSGIQPTQSTTTPESGSKPPGDTSEDNTAQSSTENDKESHAKEGGSLFGKKFRMSFGSKRLRGSHSVDMSKLAIDEKSEDSDSKSSDTKDRTVEDNLRGAVQKIRHGYEDFVHENPNQPVSTAVLPSMPIETPVLKLPPTTAVIIQEDSTDAGGVQDLFKGTVASLGHEVDTIEKVAPMWLGDLLLRNQIPFKETIKVSFVLLPYQDILPSIASEDGNSRLNANRMLRARKILTYILDRIEAPAPPNQSPDSNALKPEEYLELYCQNELVPPTMTLATLRTYIWKGSGDVVLFYKANGRKDIVPLHRPGTAAGPKTPTEEHHSSSSQAGGDAGSATSPGPPSSHEGAGS